MQILRTKRIKQMLTCSRTTSAVAPGYAFRSQHRPVIDTASGSEPSLYIPLPVPGVLAALRVTPVYVVEVPETDIFDRTFETLEPPRAPWPTSVGRNTSPWIIVLIPPVIFGRAPRLPIRRFN